MPDICFVILFVMAATGLIITTLYLADEGEGKPLGIVVALVIPLLVWFGLWLSTEAPIVETWDADVVKVPTSAGRMVQVAAVDDTEGGKTRLVNLTRTYERVFGEGSKVRFVRRKRWNWGVYTTDRDNGGIELDPRH